MKIAALALLLLAACGPQWEDRDGWAMEGDLAAEPDGVDAVLAAAQVLTPCRIEPWGGWVEWSAEPVTCGPESGKWGCFGYDGDLLEARVVVVGAPEFPDAAYGFLPHELGHYVNARCFGDYSEDAANHFAAEVRTLLLH